MSNYNYEIESLIDNVKEEHTYLSETKKEVIDGVKGNYPQLCTYEAEWIYFDETGYLPGEPVQLEYQTIENVSQATVLNAIPQPYKSASLSGQTMVNLSKFKTNVEQTSTGSSKTFSSTDVSMLKTSTTYTFIYWLESTSDTTVSNITTLDGASTQMFDRIILQQSGTLATNFMFKFSQTSRDFTGVYGIKFSSLNGTVKLVKSVILEGDYTNEDIPYFEGMTSVQNPVLTTTTDEPYQSSTVSCQENVSLRGVGEVKDELDLLTGELTQRVGEIIINGTETWNMSTASTEYSKPSVRFSANIMTGGYACNLKLMSDKIVSANGRFDKENLCMSALYRELIYIFVPRSMIGLDLEENTSSVAVQKFKDWLTANGPITVQYPFLTESITMVNLEPLKKPFEGMNRYSASSETIAPTMTLEVPIISTGAQTLQDINN